MLLAKRLLCRYIRALDQTFLRYELLELQQLPENSASLHQHWVIPDWSTLLHLPYWAHPHVLFLMSHFVPIIYKSSYMSLMSKVWWQHSARSKELRAAASLQSSRWAQIRETAWGQHTFGAEMVFSPVVFNYKEDKMLFFPVLFVMSWFYLHCELSRMLKGGGELSILYRHPFSCQLPLCTRGSSSGVQVLRKAWHNSCSHPAQYC